MANHRRPEVRAADLRGLKYFKILSPLLDRLQKQATERDKASNRQLFFDQYASLLLLYFFNPLVTSLRSIQQASQLDKVQKLLGCQRNSLGSLSEAAWFAPGRCRRSSGHVKRLTTRRQSFFQSRPIICLTAHSFRCLPCKSRISLPFSSWQASRIR
jgi:hypothetical protein